MKSLLEDSIREEDASFPVRYEEAEVALGNRETGKESSRKRAGEAVPRGTNKPPVQVQKVIRDTFSMPEADHALIQELQERLVREHALVLNKSEILRAGLRTLCSMAGPQLIKSAQSVENLKRGRKV